MYSFIHYMHIRTINAASVFVSCGAHIEFYILRRSFHNRSLSSSLLLLISDLIIYFITFSCMIGL